MHLIYYEGIHMNSANHTPTETTPLFYLSKDYPTCYLTYQLQVI
jgi:hypothetical protein